MALLSNLNYNTSDLLAFAKAELGSICTKTYLSNPPKAIPTNLGDFMVISLGSGIADRGDYGNVMLQVDIFVKMRQNGERDNSKMSTLQKSLFDTINEQEKDSTSGYILTHNYNNLCFDDFDAESGFHVLINYIKIIIIQK